MHSVYWLAGVFAMALGVGLVGSPHAMAADRLIVPDLELDALKEAVRWPKADVTAVMMLAGRFMAGRRDAEGLAYFRERAASEPGRGLFLALEGVFQARQADSVSLFRRVAWVNDAVAKLDRAVALEPGLPRYLRGVVLAGLPARFGKAQTAVEDLAWVLDRKDRFPVGLRRGAYYGLAQAYTTLGREAQASDALARSGASRLDPAQPVFIADFSLSARDGFRFRPPRLVEFAPGIHVAQGFDFGDIGFVSTDEGIVAIDAGTTEETARAALQALRRVTSRPITHIILTHAHWDHIGGLGALLRVESPGDRAGGVRGGAKSRERHPRSLQVLLRGHWQQTPVRCTAGPPRTPAGNVDGGWHAVRPLSGARGRDGRRATDSRAGP